MLYTTVLSQAYSYCNVNARHAVISAINRSAVHLYRTTRQEITCKAARHCLCCRRADAGAALSSATALAARLGPLVPVPAWALMPSALQRHWIKYSIAAAAGVSAAAFLYRHSRFAGSSDLDDWAALAAAAVKGAWADHVVSPLVVVRNELFSTFRE